MPSRPSVPRPIPDNIHVIGFGDAIICQMHIGAALRG
jgi:hypothetical protein